jgi:hypothetical protein
MHEGFFGISDRVADIWFQQAITDARKVGNDRTLTPLLARRTYDHLINTGTIQCPDLATQKRWELLMDKVVKWMLIPHLRRDIYSSFHSDGKAEDIYNEVIGEIMAFSQDTHAKEYDKDGSVQAINFKRLDKIKEIYRKNNGTVLSFLDVFLFSMMVSKKTTKNIQYEGLLDSIYEYINQISETFISVKDLLDFNARNIGDKDVKKKYRSFEEVLKLRKGYNRRAILDAMRSIRELDEKQ